MTEMVRCEYLYETPLGMSFEDVVAESAEAADRGDGPWEARR